MSPSRPQVVPRFRWFPVPYKGREPGNQFRQVVGNHSGTTPEPPEPLTDWAGCREPSPISREPSFSSSWVQAVNEPAPALSAEELLQCASLATNRRDWAGLIFQAFETRTALLLGQGLLRPEEARRAAWAWLGEELERMPAAPPWRTQ